MKEAKSFDSITICTARIPLRLFALEGKALPEGADPSEVAAQVALAQHLATERKFEEAKTEIRHLCCRARPEHQQAAECVDAARELFVACESQLVETNHSRAVKQVSDLLAETREMSEFPIRIAIEKDTDQFGGPGVSLAWERGRGRHLVFSPRDPVQLQPYWLASALLRIQSESEAKKAGKTRVPFMSSQQEHELVSLFGQCAERHMSGAEDAVRLDAHTREVSMSAISSLLSSVPYLLVDSRLTERFPVLRPAQFLCLSSRLPNHFKPQKQHPPQTPRLLDRAINALTALEALFVDWLSGGVTNFAERYQKIDGFDLCERLWQHWQSKYPAMRAGDEFVMLDKYAEILGLSGRFGWKDPFAAGGPQSLPGA
jgi:hypothetical protein